MPLTSDTIVIKPLSFKTIVWFKASNTYVLVAHETAELLFKMSQNNSLKKIKEYCERTLKLASTQSDDLIAVTSKLYADLNKPKSVVSVDKKDFYEPHNYASVKLYKIGKQFFKVSFETEALAFLIHPKFAHLEVKSTTIVNHYFEVFKVKDTIVLQGNNSKIGSWEIEDIHYFQGKFSMALLEKIYNKSAIDWMGVFHATAMSDGKNSILFMGDSGNGKSTLAALLLTQGFDLLADDFVPVGVHQNNIYRFPAAISIKENAVKTLLPLYPKLDEETLHDFKSLNKKVRYLAPPTFSKSQAAQLACKAFVFVKYEKDSTHQFRKMDKEQAFEQLIPDSWLSPLQKNAQSFLDWFSEMPCYRLTYSNNDLMYKTVGKLFADDL